MAYLWVALDAAVQGASFYVERIDLATKLRESDQKWQWSRPFSRKSPLTNFQTLTHQISLLADFTQIILRLCKINYLFLIRLY